MISEKALKKSKHKFWALFAQILYRERKLRSWSVEEAARTLQINPLSYFTYEDIFADHDISLFRLMEILAIYDLKVKVRIYKPH